MPISEACAVSHEGTTITFVVEIFPEGTYQLGLVAFSRDEAGHYHIDHQRPDRPYALPGNADDLFQRVEHLVIQFSYMKLARDYSVTRKFAEEVREKCRKAFDIVRRQAEGQSDG